MNQTKSYRVVAISYADRNARTLYEGNSLNSAYEALDQAKRNEFIAGNNIIKLMALEPVTLETHG